MKKYIALCFLFLSIHCSSIDNITDAINNNGNGEGGDGGSSLSVCEALASSSVDELELSNYSDSFNELNSDQDNFISISSSVENDYDGVNVIRLDRAVVQFDYEDGSVDLGDFGGYLARWKIIFLPYSQDFEQTIDEALSANNAITENNRIDNLRSQSLAVEVQLPGPFQGNGCEWGDSDDIDIQTLIYSNLGVYDWDFFEGTTRVIGLIYEGDDAIHDDAIAKIDISDDDAQVIVSDDNGNRITFTAFTDVEIDE